MTLAEDFVKDWTALPMIGDRKELSIYSFIYLLDYPVCQEATFGVIKVVVVG